MSESKSEYDKVNNDTKSYKVTQSITLKKNPRVYSKRTEKISFRCTPSEKKKIEQKAKRCDVSVSEYMMNLTEHDCHPKKNLEKKRLETLVKTEERMNDLKRKYGQLDPQLGAEIDDIIKGASGLWAN